MGKVIWLAPSFIKLEKHQLPAGWITERIDSICKLYQGGKLKLTKESDYLSFGFPAFSAAGQDGHVAQAEFQDIEAVILSAIGANCGRCFFASGNWTTLANVQAIIPNEKKINAKYLFYRVNRDDYWVRSGSAQPFIKPQSIKNAWVSFPKDIKVQQKIATILTTIDTAIEKTESLIEKYRKIKTGLMNDLFTRGIGQDGKLRPPRSQAPELYKKTELGWIPKEWEVITIEDFCTDIADCPHSTPNYIDSGYYCIRTADLEPGMLNLAGTYLVEEKDYQFRIQRLRPKQFDIIYSREGERLGIAAPVGEETVCLGQRVMILRTHTKHAPYFLLWYMNYEPFYRDIVRGLSATTSPHVNVGDIKMRKFPMPKENEQFEIGRKIQSVQKRINRELSIKSKLQKQKAGLMQDLLTGKVEVTVPEKDS